MSAPRPLVGRDQSENEQLARIRAGDVGAFEALFKSFYAELVGFVESYVDRTTSEEVIQELFLALWRRRESWTPAGGVRAYLFAAARNQALNAIRHRRSATRVVEECAADGSIPGTNHCERTPAQQLSTTEIESACRQAIHELPESNRLVMMLRWDYGMSHAEIAFVLGTSIKGVEAELGRGLKTLATRLSWVRA
ncbi:MAG TPA: sigma-70 family RNA polymerase sigma factor [Gemmatimonadaceae bacterium]|nr:sigma-70 family RNA polymerase sigma factor [Gemmatimonadaceae bacterium]